MLKQRDPIASKAAENDANSTGGKDSALGRKKQNNQTFYDYFLFKFCILFIQSYKTKNEIVNKYFFCFSDFILSFLLLNTKLG